MRAHVLALSTALALAFAGGCAVDEEEALSTDELGLEAYSVVVSNGLGINPVNVKFSPFPFWVTCRGTCSYNIAEGTTVTVSTSTGFDYKNCQAFIGWQGSCTGGGDRCTFVVDGREDGVLTGRERAIARWIDSDSQPNGDPCVPQ